MTRLFHLATAAVVVILGLASRKFAQSIPQFIADYAGDALWALTVFLLLRAMFPSWRATKAAAAALLFSFAIETSQLYHSPRMDEIRRTLPGRLILGHGFLWTDLLCYCAGAGAGLILEGSLFRKQSGRDAAV